MELLRYPAMCERYAGRGRDGHGARYAGPDRDGDSGPQARQDLLAAAAEDERVPALDPDHESPRPGMLDEQRVDVLLRYGRATRDLGRIHDLDVGREFGEQRPRGEPVGDDHVRLAKQLPAANGDQAR